MKLKCASQIDRYILTIKQKKKLNINQASILSRRQNPVAKISNL